MSAANESERRKGARTCIEALRRLTEAAHAPCGDGAAAYYKKRHEDAMAFAAQFGPLPPRIVGALTAVAEYIHFSETTGTPDLSAWVPFSARTQDQRAEKIA